MLQLSDQLQAMQSQMLFGLIFFELLGTKVKARSQNITDDLLFDQICRDGSWGLVWFTSSLDSYMPGFNVRSGHTKPSSTSISRGDKYLCLHVPFDCTFLFLQRCRLLSRHSVTRTISYPDDCGACT